MRTYEITQMYYKELNMTSLTATTAQIIILQTFELNEDRDKVKSWLRKPKWVIVIRNNNEFFRRNEERA